MRNEVTIHEIAKALNLSPSTITSALKGHGVVREKTRSKVAHVAGESGYLPNEFREGRWEKSGVLGSLVTHLNSPIASSVLSGTETIASEMGYSIIVHQSMNKPELRTNILQNLKNQNVEGVLVTSAYYQEAESLHQLASLDIPVVVVETSAMLPNRSRKKLSDFQNAYELTNFLIEKGCSRIAYVSAELNTTRQKNLLSGCREALSHNKLPDPEKFVLNDVDGPSPWAAIRELLISASSHPDGILFTNNKITAAAYVSPETSAIKDNLFVTCRKGSLASQNQVHIELGKLAATLLIYLSKSKKKSLQQGSVSRSEAKKYRIMNAIECIRPGELKSISRAVPSPQKGRAIIKIQRVGICGTDIHAFDGTQPYFSYPRILGHELAGELVEGDDAPDFRPGEKVTMIPYWSCGTCIACRRGRPNCCVHMQVCGVHVDGGMVEYLSIPSEALVRGNGLTLDELALVEPMAIGAHGVRRAGVEIDETVLVVGAGPIGIGIMQFCKIAGAKVIAMDIEEHRLEFCKKEVQPDFIVNPSLCNALDEIKKITYNEMPTAVFDATGSQDAINSGLVYLAHGGRYVLVGLQKGDLYFNHPEFHKRECTLMSSRNALREDFEHVISCINKRKLNPAALITQRISFSNLEDQFEDIVRSKGSIIKAMIDVGESQKSRIVL